MGRPADKPSIGSMATTNWAPARRNVWRLRARAAELYGNYRAWSERSGERFTMTCRQFAAALREEGYDDYHNNGLWFRGLCLHPNQRNDGTTE